MTLTGAVGDLHLGNQVGSLGKIWLTWICFLCTQFCPIYNVADE